MIVRIDKALDIATCRRLIAVFKRNLAAAVVPEGAIGPNLYFEDLADRDRQFVGAVVAACHGQLIGRAQLVRPVYAETVVLTVMTKGGYQPRHADNARQTKTGDWVPNHTPHRCLSMICYLNARFEGGEISFKAQALSIKPTTGLLLAFPSDQDHVHEVAPVRRGARYTLLMWWTHRRARALESLRPDLPRAKKAETASRHTSAIASRSRM